MMVPTIVDMGDMDGNAERHCGIAILDNDPFTAQGLSAVIASADGLRVAWTSTSAEQTVQRCLTPDTRPDLLLTDMSLGNGWSGADVCMRIRRGLGTMPILAITAFPVGYYARDAALAGAQGIVSKADRAQILNALRTVLLGGTWGELFDNTTIAHIRVTHQPDHKLLSGKETTVMNLLSRGLAVEDIAVTMQVSESTVKSFIARAKRKLGAGSLREAVAKWTGESDA
ncbi:hypothetical protein BW13_10440 [Bifidobacterium sp. UTCIF-37]|nr:hypothetical protein BW13_10440 [Bifidobacterium sp. UTCIF-37]TPF87578.1 hypothetical protein BW11_10715 [Bifidobacterium sp. UTCIF-38]